jgi:uncharacterized membrane protein
MRTAELLLGVSLALAACGGGDDDTVKPTGATCPAGSTLTYENFGQPFMEAYCLHCHSADVPLADRMGAPRDVNFDTLEEILLHAADIDRLAAAGPDSVNTYMPKSGDQPSEDERRQLGEWLACETTRQ